MRASQKVMLAVVALAAPFAFRLGTKAGEKMMPKKWHHSYDDKGRLTMSSYTRLPPYRAKKRKIRHKT
jgi:hypothetical protein